ncbi:MAG: hypothetical protein CME71_03580 [Halobacteriovorax sp.]|nr:hypothetical protein [Halobacteriovorax sp.]
MHAYILEHENEVNRLEKQNLMKNYDVNEELAGIEITDNMDILDAGCGTGVLTRYVLKKTNPKSMTAIDYSETRLAQAKKICHSEFKNAQPIFKHFDLMSHTLDENSYDLILSRFVMHHLPNPQVAIDTLARSLKANGKLVIIDSDGILFNIHTEDQWLNTTLNQLKSKLELDMFVGRKLRMYMYHSKLNKLESRIIPMHFTGEELTHEKDQYQERFFALSDLLKDLLGKNSIKFVEHYLAALEEPTTELFYNKFICQGSFK